MMQNMWEPVVTIATAIVGVAIIAVLVSQRSQTAGVISAAGNAFSNALGVAVSPVTGAVSTPTPNYSLSLPSQSGFVLQ